MNTQDKAAEHQMLILKFGMLLEPINKLAHKSPPPNSKEYRVAAAKFQQDFGHWRGEVQPFVAIGDVYFDNEYNEIVRGPGSLLGEIGRLAKVSPGDDNAKQAQLRKFLEQIQKETLGAISQVPIDWEPQLLEAATPYSTYLKINDAMGTATRRIHYFDCYLKADFFDLYLRYRDRSLEIRLVTTRGKADYGVVNVAAVSKLAAQEFTDYRLVQCQSSDMHDRNLRIDDNIFHIGASVKDAGQKPTNFTPADNSAAAHGIFDDLINNGTIVT